jgi:rhodanese-related sulfurtransferase
MFHIEGSIGGSEAENHLCLAPHCREEGFISQDVHLVKNHSAMTRIHDKPAGTLWGMRKMFAVATMTALLVGVSACSSSDTQSSVDSTVVDVQLVPASKVIDVRTAEEFTEGHVKGARNLSLLNGDFEKELANLDKDVAYSVYCRSGNRSGQAVELMRNAGFTNVVDLGTVEGAAKALALPIVQN